MSLGPPPSRAALRFLPAKRLAGVTLWRVHTADRGMWWFATLDPDMPQRGGRFDLPAPNGSCYLATTAATAVLEALQSDYEGGLLPVGALARRAVSSATAPAGIPPAAHLTAAKATAAGDTVGLWADRDRQLTQVWAVELHGAGWQAIHHGAQHDPTGRGRTVTLFDRAGSHPPWGDDWPEPDTARLDNEDARRVLARHGVIVTDTELPDLEVLDTS